MKKSKKAIIAAILVAVLSIGAFGGMALADDDADNTSPMSEFHELLAEKLDITTEELETKIAEVREELGLPDHEGCPGRRGFPLPIEAIEEQLGIDIDEEAFKAAMEDARARVEAGEDRQEVMADVMAEFGIDIEALKAECAENGDCIRPFGPGRCGRFPGGMPGLPAENAVAA